MTDPKLTAEFVVDAIVGYGVLAKPHKAIALLERYTAQVRSEAYEKAAVAGQYAEPVYDPAFDGDYDAGHHYGKIAAAETIAAELSALAQAPETKGGIAPAAHAGDYFSSGDSPSGKPAKPLPPSTLEKMSAGIRDTVVWLRSLGFETTDSGDGSNHAAGMDCALPYPMVAVRVESRHLIAESYRLRAVLGEAWDVQGTFSPVDGVAVLIATQAPETKGGES
jgi:hypothetical protein